MCASRSRSELPRRWRAAARRGTTVGLALVLALAVAASCGGPPSAPVDSAVGARRSGGDATVFDRGSRALAHAVPSLDAIDRRAFAVGNNFFSDNWVTAPSSTVGRDGLGPLFNAQSCSTCHFRDGAAAPPTGPDDPARGLLFRLSVPGEGAHGGIVPEPTYGDQLQDRSIVGVPAEGRVRITYEAVPGRFADGTRYELLAPTYTFEELSGGPLAPDVQVSPRLAPSVTGMGLLDAVPDREILANVDPDDRDGDGISGRANSVWDVARQQMALGRFGWKANVPTVEQQNAGAFAGDIGITSTLFRAQPCTDVELECAAAPTGGEPELDDEKLDRVTFYTRTLAVPARRGVDRADVREGEELFRAAGCSSCHLPTLRTGAVDDVDALSEQTIHPFTDLLLHDMGARLADGRPDGLATGREWRTAPLWGLGLRETVSGHTRFLHDGRARDVTEALLWHGGEAAAARRAFVEMSRSERKALLAYLRSL